MTLDELLKAGGDPLVVLAKLISELDEANCADELEELHDMLSEMTQDLEERLDGYDD